MPWKETSVMEERLRFVARLLEGEGMSEVCRSFGISRKTGYKIFNRYKEDGLEALTDRCRRPVRYANQLPEPVEAMIVRLKKEKPHTRHQLRTPMHLSQEDQHLHSAGRTEARYQGSRRRYLARQLLAL